jgi:hypothetical protein
LLSFDRQKSRLFTAAAAMIGRARHLYVRRGSRKHVTPDLSFEGSASATAAYCQARLYIPDRSALSREMSRQAAGSRIVQAAECTSWHLSSRVLLGLT